MAADAEPFPSLDAFLFNVPLYTKYVLKDDLSEAAAIYGELRDEDGDTITGVVDGFCPYCRKDSTFHLKAVSLPNGRYWADIRERRSYDRFSIGCTRSNSHRITFFIHIQDMVIQKIGQIPSVADIAINEARQKFRTILVGENWSEFYKAIGLAAHGEGIGSFVYLRRVFERLIFNRFDAHKVEKKWDESEFLKRRMDEKIDLLKDYLPPYLVEAKKLYAIFSLGIHELDNDRCLEFFDIGKRSIMIILEEDLRIREAERDRRSFASAISKFEVAAPPGK